MIKQLPAENAAFSQQFTPAFIATLSQELNDIEQNFTPTWSTQYPTLFNFLVTTAHEVVKTPVWPVASIFILFQGTDNNTVKAFLLANGTVQLDFGAQFIRNLLISEQSHDNHHAFRLAIADEINRINQEALARAEAEFPNLSDAAGWHIACPTIYQMLLGILKNLCAHASAPMPALINISFQATNTEQARALIHANGTTQLEFGAELMRKLLFAQTPETATQKLHTFNWIIAHELAHLNDPVFKAYARWFRVKQLLNIACKIPLYFGIGLLLKPYFSQHLGSAHCNSTLGLSPWLFIGIGLALITLEYLVIMLLHRTFEYNADKASAKILVGFTPEDVRTGLEFINNELDAKAFAFLPKETNFYQNSGNAILNHLGALHAKAHRFFNRCYKAICHTYRGRLHPSIAQRIAHVQNIVKK